jgi:hypothetical protein
MEPQFNQAEDMLRRVSPEGRAIAHRERVERQRRIARQLGLCVLLAAFLWLCFYGLGQWGIAVGAPAALIIFLVGCGAIFFGLRRRTVRAAQLPAAPLPSLPPKVGEWLQQQRGLLPRAALPLVDSLNRRLSVLGPQLVSVDANGPGGAAVRKLIAVELPELVERYRNVGSAGERTDRQLVDGLTIIDGEVRRLSEDLASGSFDALATQNRYLQLKYEAGLSGS